jgi:hypothetical protein
VYNVSGFADHLPQRIVGVIADQTVQNVTCLVFLTSALNVLFSVSYICVAGMPIFSLLLQLPVIEFAVCL